MILNGLLNPLWLDANITLCGSGIISSGSRLAPGFFVILSERSESKNPQICLLRTDPSTTGIRPPLRMTACWLGLADAA